MKTISKYLVGAASLAFLTSCDAVTQEDSQGLKDGHVAEGSSLKDLNVHIPYEKFTLKNGLRVIVHEDRKAPIVSVNVWYHVGSKDEPAGKTGFAHLFEHLMFNGSENFDDEVFVPLESVGGKDLNGTTWFDRTNYFETVPTSALEMALFLESDRMGHLLGAVTEEKLNNQRGVVQNEKRQGDAQPFGTVEYRQLEGLFPPGHPYRHSTIGSMEDLDNASMEDVQNWFKQYYGATNTVVVLAGDIDAATARPLMEKYFGDIAAGPPVPAMKAFVPVKSTNVVDTMIDRVPNTRIYRTWAVPGRTTKTHKLLSVAANILGGGKNSRLYQSLVYDSQIASNVQVNAQGFELVSLFEIQIDLKPDADAAKAEQILNETMDTFLRSGPSAEEVNRSQVQMAASAIRGLEKVGGFGGKAVTLAQGELYAGDPGFITKSLGWITGTNADAVHSSVKKWLQKGYYQLTVKPYGAYETVASDLDRSLGLPAVGAMPELAFPTIEEATLSNGMKIVLATRDSLPLVKMAMQFDAGYASDAGGKLGTASFALAMLDEGTISRTALEIASEAENLGAEITSSSNLDVSRVSLSALKPTLGEALKLYSDVVRRPKFDQAELDRLKSRWLAGIDQEKANPIQNVIRTLPTVLYGEGHAYAVPYQGTGTKQSITSLTHDDLAVFHNTWVRPDNATLMITGDLTMAEALPMLEDAFGDWGTPSAALPAKNITAVSNAKSARVIIIDNPGLPSTMVTAAQLLPPTGDANTLTQNLANDIFGGEFTARLNMNIREDKGWSYYAYTTNFDARGPRMWLMYSPIQVDKTREGIKEMHSELKAYLSRKPATQAELIKMKATRTNSLPGAFETTGAVLENMLDNQRFGRPYDDVTTLKSRYEAMGLASVQKAANTLKPDFLTWILVGDREKIEADVRSLDMGPVEIWDKDGKVISN